MKKIWLAAKDFSACTYYRSRAPAQFCATESLKIEHGVGLDLKKEYNALIIHGVIQPKWMQIFKDIQAKGMKIAINLDDDIFNIPEWNPAIQSYKQIERDNLAWTLDHCDLVIVSTQPLAKVCREHMTDMRDKIRVCPNLMDWTLYKRYPKLDGPIRILWAGSVHHEKDLDVIAEPLERIMKYYGSAVDVMFMGCLPDRFRNWQPLIGSNMATAVPKEGIHYVKPVELEYYPRTLCQLQPDIGLCPLANCKFNNSKSYNKAAEYILAGAQVIASDMPPYNVLGQSIYYASDWFEAIKDAIENRRDGYNEIRNNWCWDSDKKKLWDDAFKELVC